MTDKARDARLRVGVVGCGTITRNVHLPVLLSLPDVDVAWITDTNPVAGTSLSRASEVPFVEVTAAKLSLPPADVVLIAIPNGYRQPYYDYFQTRLETSLYIEKPIAKSLEEHDRIAHGRAPWQLAAGLDRRSFGLTGVVRDIFASHPFGRPVSAKVEFGGQGRVLSGGGFMTSAAAAGGGSLFQMGVHFLDALFYASGATDVELGLGRLISNEGLDIHVEADMTMQLTDGERLPLRVRVTQLEPVENQIEIVFESTIVRFSIMYGSRAIRVLPRAGDGPGWDLVPDAAAGPLDVFASFGRHWTHALDAVRSRAENYTSASRARVTSKAIGLLYALEGQPA